MSTSYVTNKPITLKKALRASNWRRHSKEGKTVVITDGHNYLHAQEGEEALEFERFGGNDPSEFILGIECLGIGVHSEHDENGKYDEIMDKIYGPFEEDDDAVEH